MTATPSPAKTNTFFELLRHAPGLDCRDNRGKKHDMAFVITGLALAICCGRDGNLSRLHRHMANHFESLCVAVQFWPERVISRAQLPLVLARVNGEVFGRLLFEWFGHSLDNQAKGWFSLDGKELRGSIQPGHTRGEACVSALAHQPQQVVRQTYYNGSKESERAAVRQLLDESGLSSQKLTLDALHLTPETTRAIHGSQGVYLIGLKPNQTHLYRYCLCNSLINQAIYERADGPERGHGRIEQRHYACYSLRTDTLALRWRRAGLNTCIKVSRSRQSLRGNNTSLETSYYVSNVRPQNQAQAEELFNAIRRHWLIEAMHYQRDVTLAEDAMRTGSPSVSRIMSNLRTLVINLLKPLNPKNMAAQIDEFADRFQNLIQFMTQQMVL